MKRFLLQSAAPTIICASLVAGYYEYDSYKGLDACASSNFVYKCVWQAVPEREPRVVEIPAEILPPPVL